MEQFDRKKMRNMLAFRQTANDGTRSLVDSIMTPEVRDTLVKWIKAVTDEKHRGTLIGGLAMSYYVKARYTEDVDLLFMHDQDLPKEVVGFRKHKPHGWEEKQHQVEVETNVPAMFQGKSHLPDNIARKVIDTAITNSGIKIATKEGLIALKLCAGRMRDNADIVELYKAYPNISMSDWHLNGQQLIKLEELIQQAEAESS